jgi:polyhydroxyalkanoate synthesis repressor PhaR
LFCKNQIRHSENPVPDQSTFVVHCERFAYDYSSAERIKEVEIMQQERLIRKYSNRRLYDTASSRHVTLDDLRQLIIAGERIKVVDEKSDADLTRAVLLQIIAEQEHFGRPVLSAELLAMIIRFYGSPMQAPLSRYLEEAFTTVLRQQATVQSEMAKALQAPFAPLADLARKNMEFWNQAFDAESPEPAPTDSKSERPGPQGKKKKRSR